MPDDAAGVRYTVLDSADSVDESRLSDFYAYPDDLKSCWVRANMIASLDGGATADGKSGTLAGPGDRAVFTHMRQLADVILVGAGTVRTENYSAHSCRPRSAKPGGVGARPRCRPSPSSRTEAPCSGTPRSSPVLRWPR